MRIFSAVRHSLDPRYYYGGLWSGNFHPALRRLGHEVIESQVDLKPAWDLPEGEPEQRRQRAAITERIIDEVRKAQAQGKIDLFLSYFYNAHFDPAGFDDVHRLGIPTVNFYCNSIYQFALVKEIAPKAQFAWHPEKLAQDHYRKIGANPVWVQMAADPEVYRRVTDIARRPTSCFVGQRYADRDRWLAKLIQANVSVDIYGPGWGFEASVSRDRAGRNGRAPGPRAISYLKAIGRNLREQGLIAGLVRSRNQATYRRETRQLSPLFTPHAKGPIPFEHIADVFAQYELILNFSNVWADGRPGSKLIPHVRLRDFEAPMCRTCFLTGHTDEIAEFYEIGKEIDTYRTVDELVDKSRYYLSHSAAAEQLRERGYQRARRDHTWERRFEELFGKIGVGS